MPPPFLLLGTCMQYLSFQHIKLFLKTFRKSDLACPELCAEYFRSDFLLKLQRFSVLFLIHVNYLNLRAPLTFTLPFAAWQCSSFSHLCSRRREGKEAGVWWWGKSNQVLDSLTSLHYKGEYELPFTF